MSSETLEIRVTDTGTREVERNLDDIGKGAEGAQKKVDMLGGALGMLKNLIAAAGIGFGIQQLIQYGEAYQKIIAQIRGVITNTNQLAATEQKLFDIAQQTRQSFEGTVSLYASLSKAVQGTSIGQAELLKTTTLVNKVLTASGSSADESAGALKRLSLSLSRGTFDSRAMTTIMMQFPALGRAVAQGLNVSISQLMNMAQAGQVTARDFFRGIENAEKTIEARFKNMPVTISQAFTLLSNEFERFIGQLNQAHGVTGMLSNAIVFLANHFDTLMKVMTISLAVFISYRAALIITAIVAGAMAIANGGVAASFMAVAASSGFATAAMGLLRGLWLSLVAVLAINPFLSFVVILTAVIGLVYAFGNSVKVSADGSITALGALYGLFNILSSTISIVVGWVTQFVQWIYNTPVAINTLLNALGILLIYLAAVSASAIIGFLGSLGLMLIQVGASFLVFLLNPVGLTIIAFTAAAVAVAYFTGTLDQLLASFSKAGDFITKNMKEATEALKKTAEAGGNMGDKLKAGADLGGSAVDELKKKLDSQAGAARGAGQAFDYYVAHVVDGSGKIRAVVRQMNGGSLDPFKQYEEASRNAAEAQAAWSNKLIDDLHRIAEKEREAIAVPIEQGADRAKAALASIPSSATDSAAKVAAAFSGQGSGSNKAPGSGAMQGGTYDVAYFASDSDIRQVPAILARAAGISNQDGSAVDGVENLAKLIQGFGRKTWDLNKQAEIQQGFSKWSSGAKEYVKTILPWVPARYGASFTVGGSGGPDSQYVPLKVTPGEEVLVRTPRQRRDAERGGNTVSRNVTVNMTVVTPDANSFNRSRTQTIQQLNGELARVNGES